MPARSVASPTMSSSGPAAGFSGSSSGIASEIGSGIAAECAVAELAGSAPPGDHSSGRRLRQEADAGLTPSQLSALAVVDHRVRSRSARWPRSSRSHPRRPRRWSPSWRPRASWSAPSTRPTGASCSSPSPTPVEPSWTAPASGGRRGWGASTGSTRPGGPIWSPRSTCSRLSLAEPR